MYSHILVVTIIAIGLYLPQDGCFTKLCYLDYTYCSYKFVDKVVITIVNNTYMIHIFYGIDMLYLVHVVIWYLTLGRLDVCINMVLV